MDSPPECVLSLSCEQPQSPPTLPSLDHSPQASSPLTDSPVVLPINSPEPSPQSPDTTPYFSLSPCPPLQEDSNNNCLDVDEEDCEEELDGIPPSPTPAVALFPGGGGQEAGCSPGFDSSPPDTPSAPFLGYGALEMALSSGQSGNCSDELDLQLFQRETVTRAIPGPGGASSGPALKFPCHVCGKRFRFQSILSLHARAHSLDRERRASTLYRPRAPSSPLKQHLKHQPNHNDFTLNHKSHPNKRLLPRTLIQHLTEEEDVNNEDKGLSDDLKTVQNPNFLLDDSTPLTPPLTEDPVSVTSPYSTTGEGTAVSTAPTFRCHACKGKFRTASELARHVRILHNPYKCTLCPFSASQEESLASHLQECHPSPEGPALTPAFNCRTIIDTPVPTPAHTPAPTPSNSQMPAAASPSLPAFRCETCGQRFTQSWFLKGHMRKHKDSLDHKCQVCGRGFKEPWFLKNHMKVHLNKLGLKAGLGSPGVLAGVDEHSKSAASGQSFNSLYSSLLLAQRGEQVRGRQRRSDREAGGRIDMSLSKSAILGYLGLPNDGSGASCMERLQAVAQVAEMGNSGGVGNSGGGGDQVSGGGGTTRGDESAATIPEGGDQSTWWQLVARSLAVAQQQQQQQQQRPQQRGHQQGQRSQGRSSVIAEADQVRAYRSALDPRGETGGTGGPWECPDCGKLFRSLQQVVVHARVHAQRSQKGGSSEEEGTGSRRAMGLGRRGGSEVRPELHHGGSQQMRDARQGSKPNSGGSQQAGAVTGFHTDMPNFKGENGFTAVSSLPSVPTRERVRGRGIKDCPYCGKAFRSSHHLKVHLRVHTGERPYKCPHCDYAGTQSGSLKYHLQRHHREQRNALSASSNSSSGFTSTINTLTSGASGLGKQRQAQLNHCPINRGPADAPVSRPSQQSWLLGLPDQREHRKALAALRDVDLETQYRYLSGVMGALYQGGMEGSWIRESPPPKTLKVSRRKPLTTSRMVQPASDKDKSVPSNQDGGFEPLDLSRRTSPSLGGIEENEGFSVGDLGVVCGGDSERESSVGVKLSQCLFCPFHTSSAELMAMHLQVNHTSKSRRKRRSSTILSDGGAQRAIKPRMENHDHDPLRIWRRVNEVQTLNGHLEPTAEHLDNALHHPESLASVSNNVRDEATVKEKVEDERDEHEEEFEENLENSSVEDLQDRDLRMSLDLSPALSSSHMTAEEEQVLSD